MAGKFQIRSKRWDVGILVGSIVVLALGIGGLFLLQASGNSAGGVTTWFVTLLGIITFAFFAGPGLVYVLRKRVKRVKDALPGGTMTWIRSHLYLPVLALVAAYAHAQSVPFRATLSSGKVLLVLGILVSVGGLARHHLIGVQKAALNVNVAIGKISSGQPRTFRRLIADYTDHKRTREDVDAQMSQFEPGLQEKWRQITTLSDEVEKHFPREGGQSWHIRQYKLWRALHPPLTIALFLVLAFHVWDVFGGTRAVAGEDQQFAAASECADCHSAIFDEWAGSTMAHAATSTINEAQLPITLTENARLIEQFDESEPLELLSGRDLDDDSQLDLVVGSAQVCIDCHTPVGGSFTEDPFALLPFGEAGSVVSGNAAVNSDGVGCIVCHTIDVAPAERDGNFPLVAEAVEAGSLGGYGTMYGPLFADPNPVPVRIHGIETPGEDGEGLWRNDLEISQLCGACHNVKLDMDGDGQEGTVIAGVFDDDVEELGVVELRDTIEDDLEDDPFTLDSDGDFILDENELDDDRIQTEEGVVNEGIDNNGDGEADGGDGLIDDLVLQTTYDEWQDYVAYFDAEANGDRGHEFGGFTQRYEEGGGAISAFAELSGIVELEGQDAEFTNDLDEPLGCNSCHMPFGEDVEEPVIDYAPGLLSTPDRLRRQHTFVGVDYDLDPEIYRKNGYSDEEIAEVLAERDALIQSAVTVEVVPTAPADLGNGQTVLPVEVIVRNNLLAHAFPTGFAFARQFWLEVSAEAGGEQVCLAVPFDQPFEEVPCGSGFAVGTDDEPVAPDEELPQCDARALEDAAPDGITSAFNGEPVTLADLDIEFAPGAAFDQTECDPWLANFQKILTDGDPDGDGVRQEVPYQPLLPDAVKTRAQLAFGIEMQELQPVRLRDVDGDGIGEPAEAVSIPYVFDVTGLDPAEVEVTARMQFRHIPPYFLRDLEARQQALPDDLPEAVPFDEVPEGALIEADELLEHMVISEVVTATSADGEEQLECEGPQNGELTILACVDEADVDDALERLNLGSGGGDDEGGQFERDDEEGLGLVPTGGELALYGPLGMALLVPVAGLRRRLRGH